jgi:tetratricopeptide (TPR) repeat protein
LHGPSGAGKTALAIALAHDTEVLKAFPDGILMVSLGPDGDPQHAQSLWGAALGNDLSSLPDTGARAAALRALLQDRHCLLIIDDVTDTEQVKALNVGGSNCVRVITTDKADEITYALKTRRYAIGKLSETEALSLITEWAGILPDIYLPTVKEIIRRLGNFALPLALVGAQARQGITWLRLLEVLRDDQGPISNLNPDEPDVRKNAVGLVMNLVLSRFGGQQMQRSALLGVFAAGMGAPFAIDAAAACWEMSPEEARAALDLMVETALLQNLPGDVYVLHTALRDHLRRSANAGALQGATTRVREHYAGLVEQASVSSKLIDTQLGQIMAVFRQTSELDPDQADAFANSLISYFEQRGLWANQVMLTAAIVEEAQKAGDLIREHAYLSDLGYAQTVLGNLDQARRYFQRELDVSQKIGDPPGEAGALNNIGAIAEREGRYDEAETYYRRSLDIRNSLGNRDDVAETLLNIAGSLYYQKRWDDALNTFQRVLDMFGVLGNRFGQAQTWLNIGAAYENMARDSEALMAYQQSLAIYSNLNEEAGQSQALNNIGIVYLNQGDTERALSHFKRSLALKERLGDRSGQASTLNNIALLYENTGSATLALEHYEQSYKLLTTLDDRRAELVQENIDKLREKMGK